MLEQTKREIVTELITSRCNGEQNTINTFLSRVGDGDSILEGDNGEWIYGDDSESQLSHYLQYGNVEVLWELIIEDGLNGMLPFKAIKK